MNAGQWYHVVAVYDGSGAASGLDVYVNGVQVDNTDQIVVRIRRWKIQRKILRLVFVVLGMI